MLWEGHLSAQPTLHADISAQGPGPELMDFLSLPPCLTDSTSVEAQSSPTPPGPPGTLPEETGEPLESSGHPDKVKARTKQGGAWALDLDTSLSSSWSFQSPILGRKKSKGMRGPGWGGRGGVLEIFTGLGLTPHCTHVLPTQQTACPGNTDPCF